MNALVLSLIRTYVPAAVGALIGWLVSVGIGVEPEAAAALTAGLSGVATAAWYTLVRLLEQKWPAAGILIGAAKSPDTYSAGTPVEVDEEKADASLPPRPVESVPGAVG